MTTKGLPGLVVNKSLEITDFLGATGPYIQFPPGAPSLALRRILHPALQSKVFAAIREAATAGRAETRRLDFLVDSDLQHVIIEVQRERPRAGGVRYRILFKEAGRPAGAPSRTGGQTKPEQAEESEIGRLQQKLVATGETFASILAEGEERYRFAVENKQVADEELQELAAKLEIANVELEATSEELRASLAASQESETQWRESEERFTRFMGHLPGLAWIKDIEGRYIYANEAAERAFGTPRDRLYGRTDRDLFPPETVAQFEENDRQALASKSGLQAIETLQQEDGVHHSIVSKFPIRSADGRLSMVGGVAFDITEQKQAEEALRSSEQRLRIALEAGQMGTWEWSLEGNKVLWSPTLEAIHGLEPGTFTGTFEAYWKDVHPEDVEKVKNSINRVLETGEEHHIEYRILWPDSSLHWVEARGKLFRNDDGTPVRMTGVCIDITDRKQAEEALRESEARFRTLADSSPVLIWVNGLEGCEFVNRAYLDFLGVKSVEVEKFDWAQFLDPAERDHVVNTYLTAFAKREIYSVQHRFRRADGEYRWMKTQGLPRLGPTGEFQGYAGSTFDITDIKEAEEALREADRRKDEFLAILGHELRNPLAAISSGTALLEGNPTPERRAWIDQLMIRQVKQLQRLVDDLLDVARITHGKIEIRKERAPLNELLEASVAAVDDLMRQRRHELSLSAPAEEVYLEADPARLEQMLVNLLTNAAKYTPDGGRVWLSAERAGKEVILRCKDTGLGLAPEVLSTIFEPFVQTISIPDRRGSGLGVGLSLVKKLADLHGGSITASSAGPGKGSEFVLRLPALAAESETVSAAAGMLSRPAPAGQSRRILLVDDNRDLATSVALFLQDAGHHVMLAHDGETAVSIASRERPEVVLLDLGLPRLNGHAVAEKLRVMPALKDTMVVAISGYTAQANDGAADAPFDLRLVKPVDPAQLLELLQQRMPLPRSAFSAQESLRILLIEDNRELALLTAELLRERGQEVEVAFDGEQGCEKARQFQPQVVICDLRLPGQSGFEVAQRLRQDFSSNTPLLVGITADTTAALQESVEQTPFDAFLSKPLIWSQFRECLEGLSKDKTSR